MLAFAPGVSALLEHHKLTVLRVGEIAKTYDAPVADCRFLQVDKKQRDDYNVVCWCAEVAESADALG